MGTVLDVAAGVLLAALIVGVGLFGFLAGGQAAEQRDNPTGYYLFMLAALAAAIALVIARLLRWP